MKYVPILRGKMGEFTALRNLSIEEKKITRPLIQFFPDTVSDRIRRAWNFETNMIYFDASFLPSITDIRGFCEALINQNINFIPVIHPNSPDRYLEYVRRNHLRNGICLRLNVPYLRPRFINTFIEDKKGYFDIEEPNIDLFIDLGFINIHGNVGLFQNIFSSIYDALPHAEIFRSIIIGAGSFPVNVASIPPDTVGVLHRSEWNVWNGINAEIKDGKFIYADYGNIHPNYDPEAETHLGSCTIKYTGENNFYVFRGRRTFEHPDGHGQYNNKSRLLVAHRCYDGRTFSWGDGYIDDCASDTDGPGNSTTWVSVTLNHHITKIIDLLP